MNLLHIIFGKCCIVCGKTVDPRCAEGICDECQQKIIQGNLKIPMAQVRNGVSLYRFEEPLRRGLHRFKYNGAKAFGVYLGKEMAERFLLRGDSADVVTCVPRAKDGRPRMYNQSAVIAKKMARRLNLPFDPCLLKKQRGIPSQTQGTTPLAREKNAKRAYCIGESKRDISKKRIVLVDDLYTTGATVNACRNLLKQRGAAEVLPYTALRAEYASPPTLVANFDRRHVHEEFHDPTPYRYRRFRRKRK